MAIKKRIEPPVNLRVNKNNDVLLTITIGNAQVGGSVVRYKGASEPIGKGEIKNLNLGNGGVINGKILKITTNVVDVNEFTNGMVIAFFFHNATPVTFFYSDGVNNDGDIFSLQTEFNLI